MAKNNNNILLRGISGSIGPNQYVRQRGGVEYIVNKPIRSKDRKPKPGEQKAWERFKNAENYAKRVIADPDLKKFYKRFIKGAQTEYNMAISDAMENPSITGYDISGYTGMAGDILKVKATDNFRVAKVWCRIETSTGDLVEEGAAQPSATSDEWAYAATNKNQSLHDTVIIFTALDMPGNAAVIKINRKDRRLNWNAAL
ncbi:hypothetical protein [Flavihumibacter fluvii]|uniref:hypothetical protein n=1 Tax=Flavihumibacter fluvii TaxID=2838157 RepID=UPI001BDF331A|nr:hypothetical protein [Flavihumibacter fluvii]ULQ52241.1 hypothetical protein KJS93_19310 [Flavihumibacter fluvii]